MLDVQAAGAKSLINNMRMHAASWLEGAANDSMVEMGWARRVGHNPASGSLPGPATQQSNWLRPIVDAKDLSELGEALGLMQAAAFLSKIPKVDENGVAYGWTEAQVFYFSNFVAIQTVMQNYRDKGKNFPLPNVRTGIAR